MEPWEDVRPPTESPERAALTWRLVDRSPALRNDQQLTTIPSTTKNLDRPDALARDLERLVPGGVRRDVPMREMTRWRVGGPADFLVAPATSQQAAQVIEYLDRQSLSWITIGHTSNLLVNDAGVRGVIVQLAGRMADMKIDRTRVWAQAGIWVPQFSSRIGRSGLTGAEHTIGIPGTLGGLVCMNGGSMRKGIGDSLVDVECVDRCGNRFRLAREECEFNYRRSAIQTHGWTVTEATFQFEFGDAPAIRRQMLSTLKQRRLKFPLKQPNCGSVFVSNPAMYAKYGPPGAVIERCGMKGFRVGDAEVSHRHANFIVNRGRATAADILQVIHEIRRVSLEQMDCELLCEVRHLAIDCRVLPAHEVDNPTSSSTTV